MTNLDGVLKSDSTQLQDAIADAARTRHGTVLKNAIIQQQSIHPSPVWTNPVAENLLQEIQEEADQVCTFACVYCVLGT